MKWYINLQILLINLKILSFEVANDDAPLCWDNLPGEILLNISKYTTPGSNHAFRLVNKHWSKFFDGAILAYPLKTAKNVWSYAFIDG